MFIVFDFRWVAIVVIIIIVLFPLTYLFLSFSISLFSSFRLKAVAVLDESDVESICSTDSLPKPTPINVLSKLRSSRLQPIADSVDLVEHYPKSAFKNHNTGSQLSLCNSSSSSVESVVNELEESTANLHLGFNHDELKLQLLKRCKQTDVLPFDEIYSAR